MEETVTILKSEYELLIKKISSLEEELSLLKNGRNSRTSSTAPLHDVGRSY